MTTNEKQEIPYEKAIETLVDGISQPPEKGYIVWQHEEILKLRALNEQTAKELAEVKENVLVTSQLADVLLVALKNAYGCMCHFQHDANPDRVLIQKQIEETKSVLDTFSKGGSHD